MRMVVLGGIMIQVWGRTDSSNVQIVLWCLSELDLPFERQDWGGKYGGNKNPEYLAINPNGLVPTLKDGSYILWESNSILRYLNAKYGTRQAAPIHPGGHGER
jgi:glutathione S-transferase